MLVLPATIVPTCSLLHMRDVDSPLEFINALIHFRNIYVLTVFLELVNFRLHVITFLFLEGSKGIAPNIGKNCLQ